MEPKATLSHNLVGKPVRWCVSNRKMQFGLVVGVNMNPGKESVEIYDGTNQLAMDWKGIISCRVVSTQELIEEINRLT